MSESDYQKFVASVSSKDKSFSGALEVIGDNMNPVDLANVGGVAAGGAVVFSWPPESYAARNPFPPARPTCRASSTGARW